MRGRERAHRKTRTRAWRRGNRDWGGGATLSGGASGGDEAASQASSVTYPSGDSKKKRGDNGASIRLVSSPSSFFVDFSSYLSQERILGA